MLLADQEHPKSNSEEHISIVHETGEPGLLWTRRLALTSVPSAGTHQVPAPTNSMDKDFLKCHNLKNPNIQS